MWRACVQDGFPRRHNNSQHATSHHGPDICGRKGKRAYDADNFNGRADTPARLHTDSHCDAGCKNRRLCGEHAIRTSSHCTTTALSMVPAIPAARLFVGTEEEGENHDAGRPTRAENAPKGGSIIGGKIELPTRPESWHMSIQLVYTWSTN